LLWVVALRGRHPAHLLAFLPVTLLLAMFARQQHAGFSLAFGQLGKRLENFTRIDLLFTFDLRQYRLSYALFAIFAIFCLMTAIREWRRRDANVFLIVTIAAFDGLRDR
jgi:hypothetical protein